MKILASSRDNLIQLTNSHSTSQPFVTFTVTNPSDVVILIKDKYNEDGYKKEIVGSTSSTISSDSFNTRGYVALNLLECLKMNSIFFNVTLENNNTVKALIDTSRSYSITIKSGSGIGIGGTYSNYNALSPSKMVLMLKGDEIGSVTMEKYNNNPSVSFNVTSPFKYMTMKYPLKVDLTAYQMYDSMASLVSLPYNQAVIMPTTLMKFQDVDYSKFYHESSNVVKILTNLDERTYNYDEWIGLSILADDALQKDYTLKKSFYTNSGVFLMSNISVQMVEKHGIRVDFLDNFNLTKVEALMNKQVGYVLVSVYDGTREVTQQIKYNVMPHCNENHEIFFLNELGGIDSFNFTNTSKVDRQINDISSFLVNHIKEYDDTYEMEYIKQKRNEVSITLSTHMCSRETAEWLNELAKSKYTFVLTNGKPMYKMICIDKFDITTNSDETEFELEMTYHEADNKESI